MWGQVLDEKPLVGTLIRIDPYHGKVAYVDVPMEWDGSDDEI